MSMERPSVSSMKTVHRQHSGAAVIVGLITQGEELRFTDDTFVKPPYMFNLTSNLQFVADNVVQQRTSRKRLVQTIKQDHAT